LNAYEFKTKFGKLIDLKDIESNQFLARFENQLVLHNSIDNLADKITPQNKGIGTGGVFAGRPLEFKSTELGFAGTQNTEICSTPYGHFYVDAKRGRIVHIDQNGKDLGIISEQSGNQSSNMKQWFREHLPFKILKDFPEADIDNKFKGLGLNMWYDDRNSRVFITKRDYISKKNPCLKYDDKIGFYSECSENIISCPDGYTYNELTEHCELISTSADLCPAGYTYNQQLKTCTLIEVSEADCVDVFVPKLKEVFIYGAGRIDGTLNIFTGETPAVAKCIYLAPGAAFGKTQGEGLLFDTLPISIGQQAYYDRQQAPGVTYSKYLETQTVLVRDIYNPIKVITSQYTGVERLVTLVDGIITSITHINDLPTCSSN